MSLDIRTLVFVLGITHIIQIVVFSYQYLINKNYRGIGWWLMWSAAEVSGFLCILLREIPSIRLFAIICQNSMIILGVIFLYIGIMRFFDRKENRWVVISICTSFFASFLYYLLVNDDIHARGVIISATLAIVSFLTAHALFFYRPAFVAASANIVGVFFIAHGCFFVFRTAFVIIGIPDNMFAPTQLNIATYVDALVCSILWTYFLIVMINQRLNSEMKESKEKMELFFKTTPESVVITRLTDGLIVYVNDGFSNLSGFTPDESIGKTTLEINLWINSEDRQMIATKVTEKGFCDNVEAVFQRKDGSLLIGMISARIIDMQGVRHIISVTRDITSRKLAEEQIKSLLAEKELLLREVHHRIKNNMTAMMSILSLQAYNQKEPAVSEALESAGNRLQSMMVLYDKLYRSDNLSEMSARDYLVTMVDEIVKIFPARIPIKTEMAIDDFVLPIKLLSPIGIIVNELITNAIKYAFSDRSDGIISVSAVKRNGHAMLIIADNGTGIPETVDVQNSDGFGLYLVNMLTRQIKGTLRIEREKGTRFVLELDV